MYYKTKGKHKKWIVDLLGKYLSSKPFKSTPAHATHLPIYISQAPSLELWKKELTLSIILYPHQHAILLKPHAVIYGHI